jgi:hypothetical protein
MDEQQYTPPSNTMPEQTPPPTPVESPDKKSSPVGSIVGAIIVIIVIIFGGLYFWGAQLEKDSGYNDSELPFLLGDEGFEADGIPPVSTSDEVFDIEADISATNLEDFEAQLDADLLDLEAELDQL